MRWKKGNVDGRERKIGREKGQMGREIEREKRETRVYGTGKERKGRKEEGKKS